MQQTDQPFAVLSSAGLGLVPERESVDDALMIVESYGPWGADLNDAQRRQIVLAEEVRSLKAQLAKFTPLRAKGVVDADDNLDCWDTNPYEICTRHVAALNEKDPAAMWRVVDLFARDEG
mgnify:CR=1 FL=1